MQRLRRLSRHRAARLDEGAFVIDGPTLLADALAAGVEIREVFATDDTDPVLMAAALKAGAVVHGVRPEHLSRAVDTVTPHGVAAVAGRVEVSLDDAVAAAAAGPLTLVLVDVADPGNAGTLVRTAEAAGASAVLFCGGSVDPSNGKCVRASAGGLFHVPVARGGDTMAVLEQLSEAGVPTAAAVAHQGSPYHDADLTGPLALLLGSEPHGLPAQVAASADRRLAIPMVGRAESLNVAMAGAIICFEALRQRTAAHR